MEAREFIRVRLHLLTFSSFFPLDLYRACSTHHAVILCEGSTLKSTFANALILFHCEAAGIMAAQHKPCIAYGSEVGAMDPFIARAAGKLCRKTYFITRTEDSFAALKKLGLRGHAGTDAAWFYDGAVSPAEAERLLREQGWDGRNGEMTGVLRRLSMLVTSRYHAAVLSMENGCPLIAVSMDERLDGLMKEIFTDKSFRFHATGKSFLFHTADKALGRKICNAMEEAYAGKEKIREKILRQVGRNREEIVRMGDFLRRYLTFRS